MRPLWYFDIEVRATSMREEAAQQSLPVMARLLRTLHSYFATNPNKFAIALPRLRTGKLRHVGNVVRVFAETNDDFFGLVDWIKNNARIAPYVTKSFPQAVEEKHIQGWEEYRRYRVPSRSSRLVKCRENRIASSAQIPYLRIKSAGNGGVFSMHISVEPGSKTEYCSPTSYGLSGENRFSLPVLP